MSNTAEQDKMLAWDKAFWLSLDPKLRVLDLNVTNSLEDRETLAADLHSQGFVIDTPVMVWGMNPYYMMLVRRSNGQDTSPYDPNVLPPAFDPPPPPPPIEHRVVGDYYGFQNEYACLPLGIQIADGVLLTQDGVVYKKRVVRGLMGNQHYFEKQ